MPYFLQVVLMDESMRWKLREEATRRQTTVQAMVTRELEKLVEEEAS